ncbi:MAG: hypothetical protein ACI4V5_00100 [Prevotella sp.]
MKKQEYITPEIKTLKTESQVILAGSEINMASEEYYNSLYGEIDGD